VGGVPSQKERAHYEVLEIREKTGRIRASFFEEAHQKSGGRGDSRVNGGGSNGGKVVKIEGAGWSRDIAMGNDGVGG